MVTPESERANCEAYWYIPIQWIVPIFLALSLATLTPDIISYYSTRFDTAQIWSWCTEYSSSAVNRCPAIYVILCVGEKYGNIKIVSIFSAIKLCFANNVLKSKTIILLNLAEYP